MYLGVGKRLTCHALAERLHKPVFPVPLTEMAAAASSQEAVMESAFELAERVSGFLFSHRTGRIDKESL
jgi:hypothetical protein